MIEAFAVRPVSSVYGELVIQKVIHYQLIPVWINRIKTRQYNMTWTRHENGAGATPTFGRRRRRRHADQLRSAAAAASAKWRRRRGGGAQLYVVCRKVVAIATRSSTEPEMQPIAFNGRSWRRRAHRKRIGAFPCRRFSLKCHSCVHYNAVTSLSHKLGLIT